MPRLFLQNSSAQNLIRTENKTNHVSVFTFVIPRVKGMKLNVFSNTIIFRMRDLFLQWFA